MHTHDTTFFSAAALFRVASALHSVADGLRSTALRWHARLEQRRVAAAALDEFASMGERELRDIGVSRADVQRVAWGASNRDVELP